MYDSVSSSILPLWAVAYISPNNHVGYASLVWLGHFVWGDSIPGMRVFSFLAWSISIVILFQIYFELFKRDCCFSLISVSMTLPMVMTLGVLSRGYSIGAMLIYAALLMVLRGQTLGDTLLTGFVASLALWMVPSMFYGIILIYGLILWKHWNDKKYAFLISSMFCLVSILGAIAFYLPILLVSGVESLLANPYVVSTRATISSMYGNWLSNLFIGECKAGQDCPLFSGPAASMVFLSAALHRIFYLPKRHLIVLALLPLASVFLFPLLHGRLPPPRTLAFMGPIILLFWGGAVTPKMHVAYGGLALIALFVIFAQRTSLVQNDISFPSNDAHDAAITIATSPPTMVQTKHWADYACLRFYLRRAGWKGIVDVPIARFDAPWLFDGRASHLWHANHAPEGYKPTSVKGLYRADARVQ